MRRQIIHVLGIWWLERGHDAKSAMQPHMRDGEKMSGAHAHNRVSNGGTFGVFSAN